MTDNETERYGGNMLLTVDIGNTSTVFCVFDGEKIIKSFRTGTGDYTEENIKADGLRPEAAIVSSVVPSVNAVIQELISMIYNCKVVFLDTDKKTGLKICTDYPERVGADIICGAAAAYYRYKKAVIVFDLGTASTVCAVDSRGNYLGHSIYPGVHTSFSALHMAAEQLPEITGDYGEFDIIGKNTVSSMKSGVIAGAACFIDGMTERYRKELGEEAEVIVTGGMAPVVLPYCSGKYRYDENLLPDGLRIIYNLTYNQADN